MGKNKRSMSDKSTRCFTVHCAECLRIIGVSIKNFQQEAIFCMKCGKEKITDLNKQIKVDIE